MLKDMALGPPILSISFRDMNWPRAMKSTSGTIKDSRKVSRGEVSSTISLLKVAPAS